MATRFRAPARVLLVMEVPLASLVALTLNHGGYVVRSTVSAVEGVALMQEWQPHLAIVDLDLDDNASLIGKRRNGGKTIPVVVLTRRGDLRAKLDAFDRGADDIVTIPFSPEELVARVLAVMRRSYGQGLPFFPVIRVGELEIDMASRRVRVGSARLRLTSLEQALLYLLAANRGHILSREMILDTLWGSDYVAESNVVDRHVRNLRRKLGDDWRSPRFIETLSGEGYRFVDASAPYPVTRSPARRMVKAARPS